MQLRRSVLFLRPARTILPLQWFVFISEPTLSFLSCEYPRQVNVLSSLPRHPALPKSMTRIEEEWCTELAWSQEKTNPSAHCVRLRLVQKRSLSSPLPAHPTIIIRTKQDWEKGKRMTCQGKTSRSSNVATRNYSFPVTIVERFTDRIVGR